MKSDTNDSFSALRVDGKRAYEYARSGEELPKELTQRAVKVTNLELVEWFESHSFPVPKEEATEESKTLEQAISHRKPKLTYTPQEKNTTVVNGPACKLRMTVSGGFYVRSLCYDLGMKMDSGAYMAELVRTRQGEFRIEDAIDLDEFVEGGAWEEKVVRVLSASSKEAETQATGQPEEKRAELTNKEN
jgi:tRNA pseudouridine55 synthase